MTEQVLTRAGGRVEVVASLSQGRTPAAQCGLFTHKSVPVIFEPPCTNVPHMTLMSNDKREVQFILQHITFLSTSHFAAHHIRWMTPRDAFLLFLKVTWKNTTSLTYAHQMFIRYSFIHSSIHSFSSPSYDGSEDSSKASSPHSAI